MIKLCLHAVECHCCQTQFVKALYVIAFTQSCLHNSSLSFEMSFSRFHFFMLNTTARLTYFCFICFLTIITLNYIVLPDCQVQFLGGNALYKGDISLKQHIFILQLYLIIKTQDSNAVYKPLYERENKSFFYVEFYISYAMLLQVVK